MEEKDRPLEIDQLEHLLTENSINIAIDKDVQENGDKVLYVDFGEEPVKVDGNAVSRVKEIFSGDKSEIVVDGEKRYAKIWLETSSDNIDKSGEETK